MSALESNFKGISPIRESRLLPRLVVEQIRWMIQDGEFPAGSQLPSEPDLAKALNISRSTLRAALSYLENEGTIVRRRGVGTFIADRPHLSNKLNINWGVTQIIQATGATPGISEMNFDIQPASRRMVDHLQVELGAPILLVERVRTADATPVSISIDYLALERIRCGKPVDNCVEHFRSFLDEHQSIYRFLEMELGHEKGHATAWLRPMVANEDMAMKLDVPLHSPILYLEQLDFDLEGNPLLLTDEYFAGDAFIFSVHRSP
jgi:GntR family transcriptional regulator